MDTYLSWRTSLGISTSRKWLLGRREGCGSLHHSAVAATPQRTVQTTTDHLWGVQNAATFKCNWCLFFCCFFYCSCITMVTQTASQTITWGCIHQTGNKANTTEECLNQKLQVGEFCSWGRVEELYSSWEGGEFGVGARRGFIMSQVQGGTMVINSYS